MVGRGLIKKQKIIIWNLARIHIKKSHNYHFKNIHSFSLLFWVQMQRQKSLTDRHIEYVQRNTPRISNTRNKTTVCYTRQASTDSWTKVDENLQYESSQTQNCNNTSNLYYQSRPLNKFRTKSQSTWSNLTAVQRYSLSRNSTINSNYSLYYDENPKISSKIKVSTSRCGPSQFF